MRAACARYHCAMLHYKTIPVTPFAQNCSLIWCDATMDGAVIDPGGDLPVLLAEDPLTCVVRGCGMALERMDSLGTVFSRE